jgi:hypothetical protein
MSENCRYYRDKMEARRTRPPGPLHGQWLELMAVVAHCERVWAVEDRVERSL